jgi:hypothetical protein
MDTERKRLYVETTIPSYATAWTSADPLTAEMQATTKRFWNEERDKFELFVSRYVINECSLGDKTAAQRRLDFIDGIERLSDTDESGALALVYQELLGIPEKAVTDCSHLAVCVMSQMDYLLTWISPTWALILSRRSRNTTRRTSSGRPGWSPRNFL